MCRFILLIIAALMVNVASGQTDCKCISFPWSPKKCKEYCTKQIFSRASFGDLNLILGIDSVISSKIILLNKNDSAFTDIMYSDSLVKKLSRREFGSLKNKLSEAEPSQLLYLNSTFQEKKDQFK